MNKYRESFCNLQRSCYGGAFCDPSGIIFPSSACKNTL